jgi:predicted MFS family arabinose efflux permease
MRRTGGPEIDTRSRLPRANRSLGAIASHCTMPIRSRLASPSLVLFGCMFASQAAMLVLSPVLPEIAREFGVSEAAAGQLRAISGATGGVTAVLLAVAARRPGARALLSAGAGLVALGAALSAAAPSFVALAAAQAVLGVGVGVLVAVGIAAAGMWAAPGRRAHVLAWAIAGMPAAWITGMPVVGLGSSSGGWRMAFLAVPMVAALVALGLVRLRVADAPTRREGSVAAAWRSPAVVRFTAGELLANAAWAGVLTYAGALLLGSYDVSPGAVAAGLGAAAAAMVPGTFTARRSAARPARRRLASLTLVQAGGALALGAARPAVVASLVVLAAMAFVNGRRSMVAGALGMDAAPQDPIAPMAMRAAANQLGYLLGAALGGLALALGGFTALGAAFAGLFLLASLIHLPTTERPHAMFPADRYSIRAATPMDQTALEHIALLDGQRPLEGSALVGLIDGRPAAAVSLDDGRAIADPFRSTGHLVAHLRVRAAGVNAHERMPSVRDRLFAALSPAVRRAARSAA